MPLDGFEPADHGCPYSRPVVSSTPQDTAVRRRSALESAWGFHMNRRFVVLGLALAMCGTGSAVAGQSETRLSELAPDAVQMQGSAMAMSLRAMQHRGLGPLVVTVESVGPSFTRIHLIQQGVELATFESAAFTVTSGADGTTITSSGRVRMRTSSGRMRWTDDGLEVRTSAAGEFVGPWRSGPASSVR